MNQLATHGWSADEQLRLRLQNAFRILAQPEHELYGKALELRQEISSKWQDEARREAWFPWPATDAPRGYGRLNTTGWKEHGMLGYLGYHVGQAQPTLPSVRWNILEYAFECHLPPLNDRAYYRDWAKPQTPERLQKLADTLAAFTRNAKRRDEISMAVAIEDWENDLLSLRKRYYEDFFHFGWPGTELWH